MSNHTSPRAWLYTSYSPSFTDQLESDYSELDDRGVITSASAYVADLAPDQYLPEIS